MTHASCRARQSAWDFRTSPSASDFTFFILRIFALSLLHVLPNAA